MRFLVALAIFVACAEAKGWWMEQPYGSDDFNDRVEYGEELNMTCEDPRLNGENYTVEYWVLPDLTIMRANDYVEFVTLDGMAGWEVSADTSQIRLFLVQEKHFGFYHCLATLDNSDQVMVKRAVNYKGPFFDDLWDDYRMNTIVACSSSLVFLAIVGGLYGFNMWYESRNTKVEPGEEEEDDEEKSNGKVFEEKKKELEGYSNEMVNVIDEQPQSTSDGPAEELTSKV